MAFTRFHDDPARIKKQLQESTGPEDAINAPEMNSSWIFRRSAM